MSDPVNCELMSGTTPPNQSPNQVRDPHLLPTAMIRYMVVVLARPIFGSHCLVEEQLLQIKFDWPVRLANGYRDPHLLPTAMIRYMVVVLARPIFCGVLARPILADIESYVC